MISFTLFGHLASIWKNSCQPHSQCLYVKEESLRLQETFATKNISKTKILCSPCLIIFAGFQLKDPITYICTLFIPLSLPTLPHTNSPKLSINYTSSLEMDDRE